MKDAAAPEPSRSPFRLRAFQCLFATRIGSNTANQMQAVAVGWQVYDLTDSALHLGLIGLVQFIAPICLTLAAGQVADRYDRRLILRTCYVVEMAMTAILLVLAGLDTPPVWAIYGALLVNSMARTFEGPSLQSLLPMMVPRDAMSRAVAAYASAHKASLLAGPSLGGLLYGFGPLTVYGTCAVLILAAGIAAYLLPPTPAPENRARPTWKSVFAGLAFIWANPSILGAMSLDLVGSLFGGVTALLPIFARDILDVGPWGFGVLRSAPAVGALALALVLARYPITRSGGRVMFIGMTVYGAGMLLFGVSENLVLSIVLLIAAGMGDMLATVIRQTLIQVQTPSDMLGRVYAVNSLFVGVGGQMGQFRAGVTAEWLGAVGSVVLGGVVVLLCVALWLWRFGDLRRLERPDAALISEPVPSSAGGRT